MRINKKVFQSTINNNQSSVNPTRKYQGNTIVLRESIASLSIRLFFAETFLGLSGLAIRVPIIYLLNNYNVGLSSYIIYALTYFLFQIINVSLLIWIIVGWYNHTYVIRNNDIAIKSGVFNIEEKLLQYDNVEKMSVHQNLLGRILGFGSIDIFNPLLRENLYLNNIPEPKKYAQIIQDIVPKAGLSK